MDKVFYDKLLQSKIVGKLFYTSNPMFSRSQVVRNCNKCGDTSFEMLDKGKLTGKCCRCGEKFAKQRR